MVKVMKEILVVGIPRSGTTYVYRSLAGLEQGDTSPRGKHIPIGKAHSLGPPDTFGDPMAEYVKKHVHEGRKTIFVSGNPYQSVFSTLLRRFGPNHFANCGCTIPITNIDLSKKDCLNYELMFDTWMSGRYKNFAAVRYETMCRHYDKLNTFVGRKVKWLPWRERDTKGNKQKLKQEIVDNVYTTYKSLYNKIQNAEDITIVPG